MGCACTCFYCSASVAACSNSIHFTVVILHLVVRFAARDLTVLLDQRKIHRSVDEVMISLETSEDKVGKWRLNGFMC